MDHQGQLTDQEQMMLGAQQAALLKIQDSELECKAQQQHAMLEEEKLLEAQHEALAMSQEAELRRLQTIALMESEQERLQSQASVSQIITQMVQPVVYMQTPMVSAEPVVVISSSSIPIQSQVPIMAPQIITTSLIQANPEMPFVTHHPIMQETQFMPQVSLQEAQFTQISQAPMSQEVSIINRPPLTSGEMLFVKRDKQPENTVLMAQVRTSEGLPKTSGSESGSGPVLDSATKSQAVPAQQKEIKLPQALEKMLAFKDVRAQQVGVKPEDVERVEKGELLQEEGPIEHEEYAYIDDEEEQAVEKSDKKESKNKKRKKRKKRAKARKMEEPKKNESANWEKLMDEEEVQIEYIPEEVILERTDPGYHEFARIFQAFKIEDPVTEEKKEEKKDDTKKEDVPIKARGLISDDSDDDEPNVEDDDKPKLSKKKQKKINRLSVAELKQLVTRPDVVEMHDVTARDPKLLVHIKATRNSVPVPRHWCFKRKYLQGKRGIEKPPFDLPDFIKATGIMEMRQALQEKEDQKTMKSKMRERVRPKMGKIDIDYKKLHDAFFKWLVKPKLSIHGDLYYEGKEFETRLKEKKPGNLSDELRTALGMPIGPNCDKYPPPWLIAMQRYGPPPSYPNLKIPGLNAPIPDTCAFGYHAGGWGKPPVDETGKPLYGDVFGTQTTEAETPVQEEEIDKSQWGELESESEEEEESEEESEEDGDMDASGLVTPGDAGLVTPSGVTSIPMGVETPDMIELRKRRIEDAMDQGGDTPALYQILPEKKTAVGAAMMGSAHVYDISAVTAGKKGPETSIPGAEVVEVALNPDELDLDTAAMQAKYDQTMREQQSHLEKEDLSDMVAEHAAKQQKKRKKQQQDGKSQKKYKEFKF